MDNPKDNELIEIIARNILDILKRLEHIENTNQSNEQILMFLEDIFYCEYNCGFSGNYQVVLEHEKTCTKKASKKKNKTSKKKKNKHKKTKNKKIN